MHYNLNSQLIHRATSLREMLSGRPAFRLNLANESLNGIVLVIFCAIWMGEKDEEGIYNFLQHHGATTSQADMLFILDVFTGDDCKRHLWFQDLDGSYKPLLGALPGYRERSPGDFGYDGVPA